MIADMIQTELFPDPVNDYLQYQIKFLQLLDFAVYFLFHHMMHRKVTDCEYATNEGSIL
jgi:hypothetical protein